MDSFSPLFLKFCLQPHLPHMEVPELRVKSELQLGPKLQPRQQQIWSASVTYVTAQILKMMQMNYGFGPCLQEMATYWKWLRRIYYFLRILDAEKEISLTWDAAGLRLSIQCSILCSNSQRRKFLLWIYSNDTHIHRCCFSNGSYYREQENI